MSEVTAVRSTAAPPSERRWIAPDKAIWLLAFCMAAAAVALTVVTQDVDVTPSSPPSWAWWALLPLFALTESLVVHMPSVRSSHSHTLREIPALAGLVFLSPGE